MSKTGKLYTLTLMSSLMTIVASLLVAFWNEKTSAIHYWFDLVPHAFGMASLITTTLIVRTTRGRQARTCNWSANQQAMIAAVYKEDMAVATGSKSTWFNIYIPCPLAHIIQSHTCSERQDKYSASAWAVLFSRLFWMSSYNSEFMELMRRKYVF